MSRILLLVNGLGLGNSTRCHAVIERLRAAGADIEVVTSDNGLWYFADKPEAGRVSAIPALRYGQSRAASASPPPWPRPAPCSTPCAAPRPWSPTPSPASARRRW